MHFAIYLIASRAYSTPAIALNHLNFEEKPCKRAD
jgi:hypothetical protein